MMIQLSVYGVLYKNKNNFPYQYIDEKLLNFYCGFLISSNFRVVVFDEDGYFTCL